MCVQDLGPLLVLTVRPRSTRRWTGVARYDTYWLRLTLHFANWAILTQWRQFLIQWRVRSREAECQTLERDDWWEGKECRTCTAKAVRFRLGQWPRRQGTEEIVGREGLERYWNYSNVDIHFPFTWIASLSLHQQPLSPQHSEPSRPQTPDLTLHFKLNNATEMHDYEQMVGSKWNDELLYILLPELVQ